MAGLAAFREQYPQYNDVSDVDLADSLHAKFYSDIPRDEYLQSLGIVKAPGVLDRVGEAISGKGEPAGREEQTRIAGLMDAEKQRFAEQQSGRPRSNSVMNGFVSPESSGDGMPVESGMGPMRKDFHDTTRAGLMAAPIQTHGAVAQAGGQVGKVAAATLPGRVGRLERDLSGTGQARTSQEVQDDITQGRKLPDVQPGDASLTDAAKDIGYAIKMTPWAATAAGKALLEGKDPEWGTSVIGFIRDEADKNQSMPGGQDQYYLGITREKLRNLPQNLAFSLFSMGAGLAAGFAGTLTGGPVGGYAAGMMASGVAAYRMDTNGFMRDLRDKLDAASQDVRGRPFTDDEFVSVARSYEGLATEHGLYEAIPEAIGNVVGYHAGKAIFESAKLGLRGLTKSIVAGYTELTGEASTEAWTQMGQHNVETDAGMNTDKRRDWTSAADWSTSLKEVLPDVALLTGVMGAGVHVAGKLRKDNSVGAQIAKEMQDSIAGGQFNPAAIDAAARQSLDPANAQVHQNPRPVATTADIMRSRSVDEAAANLDVGLSNAFGDALNKEQAAAVQNVAGANERVPTAMEVQMQKAGLAMPAAELLTEPALPAQTPDTVAPAAVEAQPEPVAADAQDAAPSIDSFLAQNQDGRWQLSRPIDDAAIRSAVIDEMDRRNSQPQGEPNAQAAEAEQASPQQPEAPEAAVAADLSDGEVMRQLSEAERAARMYGEDALVDGLNTRWENGQITPREQLSIIDAKLKEIDEATAAAIAKEGAAQAGLRARIASGEIKPPAPLSEREQFQVNPIPILEKLIASGEVKDLYKAAGVKSLDGFEGLPMSDRMAAFDKLMAPKAGAGTTPIVTPQSDNAKSATNESAIDAALRSVGIDPNAPVDKAKQLRREAEKLQREAREMLGRIPPGQPVSSTRDRNLREKSGEKSRKAGELFDQADALDAAKSKTEGDQPAITEKAITRTKAGKLEITGFSRDDVADTLKTAKIKAVVTVGNDGRILVSAVGRSNNHMPVSVKQQNAIKKALMGAEAKPKKARKFTGNLRNDVNLIAPGLYAEVASGGDGEGMSIDMSLVADSLKAEGFMLPTTETGKDSDAVLEIIREDIANGGGTLNERRQLAAMTAEEQKQHRLDVLRLADEYGIAVKRGAIPRKMSEIEAELEVAIKEEIGIAGQSMVAARDAALEAGIPADEIDELLNNIADFHDNETSRDKMVLMYREQANALQEKIDAHQEREGRDGQGQGAVEHTPPEAGIRAEERPSFELDAQTPAEAQAELDKRKAAEDKARAEAAELARKEKAARDKAEKDRRAAAVIAEDKARRDAELAALQNPDAFEFGADAPAAPAPVIKKVSTEQARGQGDIFGSPPADAAAITPKQAETNPRMIGAGDILYTESNRKMSPAPKMVKSATSNVKRMNAWLLDEARKEAEANGNDWQGTLLKGLDATKMSQADQDTVNEILFGDAEGPQAKHRAPHDGTVETPPEAKSVLKPLVDAPESKQSRFDKQDRHFYYADGSLGMKSDGSFTAEKRYWMTFTLETALPMDESNTKPYGATRRGVFIGTESGEKLIPRPKPVTPQTMSEGQFKTSLGISADSIEQLRKIDVDRVITSTPAHFRADMAGRIKKARPDLAQEVDDVMAEAVNPEQAKAPSKFADNGEALNDAERELRDASHTDEQAGDVLLGNGRYVAFDTAVRLAREGIESGAFKAAPAQLNFRLDMAMRDADRVLAAATEKVGAGNTAPVKDSLTAEASNEEDGGVSPTTQKTGPYTMSEHAEIMDKLRAGKLSIEEYRAAFDRLIASKDALTAEFKGMTKDAIMKAANMAGHWKSETKDKVIRSAVNGLPEDFHTGESISYVMGQRDATLRKFVADATQETLDAYAARRKAAVESYVSRRKEMLDGIQNPKTLDDFSSFMSYHRGEGKTFKEARMMLSPEQRARFDELAGEKSRGDRKARADQQKTDIRVAAQTTEGQIIETKHTRDGYDLFVVKAAERVERDVYNQWNATAKRLGGRYSAFRGNGAVPGFQFRTRESADAFLSFIGGNAEQAKEVAQVRRDEFADDRSQSAVERLNEMADKLDEKADESLSVERKANTDRRARFAAAAESAAQQEKALATTMRNIAKGIDAGTVKFLDRVRQKTQVEMLREMLARAKDNEIRAKYESYADQQKHQGEKPTDETADYADWPTYTAYRSDLAKLGRHLSEVEGLKKMGASLLKVADDVSDAYLAFAKEPGNFHKVARYSKQGGGIASFTTRDGAETAIARSGYRGKAIPFQIKRGEYTIIDSPTEARERGVWQGDDDKRITLTAEFGDELVDKLAGGRRGGPEAPWQFVTAREKRKRLSGLGIETPPEFRAALREFAALREPPNRPSRVKELERAMTGRAKDGLDFFPTPESVADAMVETAGIEPGMSVLEPSAGWGHIAERIRAAGVDPDVVEMSNSRAELLDAKGFNVIARDFMDLSPRGFTYGDVFTDKQGRRGVMSGSGGLGSGRVGFIPEGQDARTSEWVDRDDLTGVEKNGSNSGYDRILMNPPFSDRRDAEHVRHAYTLLRPGGRLVAIMGEGVFFGQDKKAQAFRDWLEEVGGTSEKLEEGSFLDPTLPVNTGVNARLVVIEKSDGEDAGGNFFDIEPHGNEQSLKPSTIFSALDWENMVQSARDSGKIVLSEDDVVKQYGSHFDLAADKQSAISRAIDRAIAAEQGKELTPLKRESARLRLTQLRTQRERGKISDEKFIEEVDALHARMQLAADVKRFAPYKGRARGADFIRQKLLDAKRNGDISEEAADLAEWFVLQNPALLDNLGISIKTAGENEEGARGRYMPLPQIVRLFKEKAADETMVHEVLHHLERMMPADMQDEIRAEFIKQIHAERQAISERLATSSQAADELKFIEDATSFYAAGDMKAAERMKKAIQDGRVPADYYRFFNPSEFWAVGMTDTVAARYKARGSIWARTLQWLREALEHIKGALDLKSDAAMLRALNQLMKRDNGEFESKDMLGGGKEYFSQGARQQPIPNTGATPPAPPTRQAPIGLQGGAPGNNASWNGFEATKLDDVIRKLQDKQIDSKRTVQAIKAAGRQVADKWDPYLQETLFHGRAAKRTLEFTETEIQPLVKDMALRNVSIPDLDQYLHARHAEEANKLISDRNPAMPDGGSGMTNQQARDYFANLDPAKRKHFEALAKRVDAIIAETRQLYVAYGLESQETVDGWADTFDHYVPLMREDKDGGMGIGQGFSIKGKESKSRTGSTRAVVDILANIAMQRERAIVRGEKNRVAVALMGLAKLNPNEDFWTFDKVPTEQVFNPTTGLVESRPDPMFKSRDNVVVAKIADGKGGVQERAVVFNEDNEQAMNMARALKNLDAAQLEGLLGVTAKITRYFAAINTQWNPVFGVTNLTRDFQAAMLGLNSTPIANHKADVAKHTFSALKGIYTDIRKMRGGRPATSSWAQLWEEFQHEGGQTGYRDMFRTSADRAKAIEHMLDPHNWTKSPLGKVFTAGGMLKVPLTKAQDIAAPIFDWLSDYNESMENAVRLATYKVGKEQGMSNQQAAAIAKSITVNFNRRGSVGLQAGALYAFFNASMQGTARIVETLFTIQGNDIKTVRLSGAGKKIVAGGILLGSLQALILAAMGFDEDDPPEFVRERNTIIPIGNKKYITIPMPLGFAFLPNVGRIATEYALAGGKGGAKRLANLFAIAADMFNPVGGSGSILQILSPTALDPLVAIGENKDWTGKPIAKQSYDKTTPGFKLWRDTASTPSKIIAEAINSMSGGTRHVAGALSPTPDQIDYLFGQVTGGVGRELSKAEQTIAATIHGEDLPPHKIPLVGRFYGDSGAQSSQASAFYSNINRINEYEAEVKGLRKEGKGAEAAKFIAENPEARLIMRANYVEKIVREQRKRKHDLIEKGASRGQIKIIENRIKTEMQRFNDAVKALKQRQKEAA